MLVEGTPLSSLGFSCSRPPGHHDFSSLDSQMNGLFRLQGLITISNTATVSKVTLLMEALHSLKCSIRRELIFCSDPSPSLDGDFDFDERYPYAKVAVSWFLMKNNPRLGTSFGWNIITRQGPKGLVGYSYLTTIKSIIL